MDEKDLPAPQVVTRSWIPSLVWAVPLIAALVGLALLVNTWRAMGPKIVIRFQTAQGLEVGKTLVKYRNVTIGHVTAIALSADRTTVLVTADLVKSAADIATAGAQFWVVRPRFGVGWVSGIDTLLSGPFIGAEAGTSATPRRSFIGLENPPPLPHALHGKRVVLRAPDLGSVSLGAPVYYKRFQVGRVIDEGLNPDGRSARIELFIDAPNDRFVTAATRFWNVSGVEVKMGANGIDFKADSFASVLAGGIEFGNAPILQETSWTDSEQEAFTLFKDEAAAMATPDGEGRYFRMRFQHSVRGLSPGAPVEFIGVNIGSVYSIDLDYDVKTREFPVVVTVLIYPRRMGRAHLAFEHEGMVASEAEVAHLIGELVARGLRAQPRLGNLLSGQLYLALEFVPGAPPVRFDMDSRPLEIPTVSGSITEIQSRLASIAEKVDRLPLADMARHLDEDLVSLHGTLDRVNANLVPKASDALDAMRETLGNIDHTLRDDAPWREGLDDTLAEARESLRSFRSLTDYLDRHPEALIRGRRSKDPQKSAAPTSAAQAVP